MEGEHQHQCGVQCHNLEHQARVKNSTIIFLTVIIVQLYSLVNSINTSKGPEVSSRENSVITIGGIDCVKRVYKIRKASIVRIVHIQAAITAS